MGSNGSSKGGRRRGPRRSSGGRGGRRVVLAGRGVIGGAPWELWVPEDMPEADRAALVERQRALLEAAAAVAGRATSRPVQLALGV